MAVDLHRAVLHSSALFAALPGCVDAPARLLLVVQGGLGDLLVLEGKALEVTILSDALSTERWEIWMQIGELTFQN